MREGSAEVVIACPVDAAFAWLADPRNAGEWFASVALLDPPERPLRAGATWRFSMTRQQGKNIPLRLADYQPTQRFTWETLYPAWRDNLQWTLTFAPEADDARTTRLRLTILQRPGPLGWPALLLAAALARLGPTQVGSIAARAERAAERARDALEALPTLSYGSERRADTRRSDGGKRGSKGSKGGKGGKRR